jgi:hypothetical protein
MWRGLLQDTVSPLGHMVHLMFEKGWCVKVLSISAILGAKAEV